MQKTASWPFTTWCSTHRAEKEGRQTWGTPVRKKQKRPRFGGIVTKHNESGILANTVWYKNLSSNVHIYVFFSKISSLFTGWGRRQEEKVHKIHDQTPRYC